MVSGLFFQLCPKAGQFFQLSHRLCCKRVVSVTVLPFETYMLPYKFQVLRTDCERSPQSKVPTLGSEVISEHW